LHGNHSTSLLPFSESLPGPFWNEGVGEIGTNREGDETSIAHCIQDPRRRRICIGTRWYLPPCSLLLSFLKVCLSGALLNIGTLSSHFQKDIYYYYPRIIVLFFTSKSIHIFYAKSRLGF